MARRRLEESDVSAVPDLTAMMDLTFNIISFFVMINTFAQDQASQKIQLPYSMSAAIVDDERIPDSLNINVDREGRVLSWGLSIDMNQAAGVDQFVRLIRNEAALQRDRQREQGSDGKKVGLTTTLVLRIDRDADYQVFRKVVELCRQAGFDKFQLKALEEEAGGPKA